jgi:hypothetical protein
MAITSPLLEDVSINGATGILVNITGGPDLTLAEVNDACSLVHEAADPDANIIFGSVIDPNLTEEVRITVIATGFQSRMAADTPVSSAGGRPTVKKLAEHQMTLPMHSASASPSPSAVTPFETPAHLAPMVKANAPVMPAAAVASASTPVFQPFEGTDTEVEIDEAEINLYPPLPSLFTPSPVYAHATPAAMPASDSRPVIRPAVASPISAVSVTSSARRVTSSQPTTLATAHLGIEESEFDKPTYLRRAMASEGMRSPGDGKG